MKKTFKLMLGLVGAFLSQAAMADGRSAFLEKYFSLSGHSPLSYVRDEAEKEVSYSALGATVKEKPVDGCTLRTLTYTDARGIRVTLEARIFADFEAVEWVARLKNTSATDSPVLEHINVCRTLLPLVAGESTMYYARGSNGQINDFEPLSCPLSGEGKRLGTDLGRSSDVDNLPFFNLTAKEGGIVVGVGWTGSWRASVVPASNGNLAMEVGFSDKTKFYLRPGEEVRTPSVVLMFWKGSDRMEGHNRFRQLVLSHFTPQVDGRPMQCPITMPLGYNGPSPCVEFNCSNEWKCLSLIEFSNQVGLTPDLWWIDAGWYKCAYNDWYNAPGVGTWTPDSLRFPHGMKPIGKAAHKHNQGFLVWFEPERVFSGSWLWNERPEWLLRTDNPHHALLNLGNPEAVKWISRHIIKYAKRDGLTWYRQDFNIGPNPFWESHDEPGRNGLTEIRHIEGLYQFWDNLRAAGIAIDNCASGGRRIDLETIKRSIPLWRTDYNYCEPVGYQSQTYGLSYFLPCHTTGTSPNPVPYLYRSGMTNGGVTTWDVNQRDFHIEGAKKLLKEHHEIRDFYYGDFHPLLPYTTARNAWIGYQFHSPESAAGMALAFRREEAESAEQRITFQALDPQARYEVWNRDADTREVRTGRELMQEGLLLTLPDRATSLLLTYRKQ